MQTIKVLIVEDDLLIARDVQLLLQDWGYTVVGCAADGEEAFEFFNQHAPDLALIDIQIKGAADGTALAHRFNAVRPIPFIYLTAQADWPTVERAKATNPGAYLLKPFDERHLHISIELALANFFKKNAPNEPHKTVFAHEVKLSSDVLLRKDDQIFIKQNFRFVKFRADDLIYIEADRNHSTIVTAQHKFIVRFPLATVLERLELPGLVRVHRSFAINLKFVEEFDESEIIVNGRPIPFTAAYRNDFLNKFKVI